LLIEKLCAIDLRADKLESSGATAFAVRENDTVNTGKTTKRVSNCAKQKFPCNKCKQLDHWAAECPQKQQHSRDKVVNQLPAKVDTLPVHVMGTSEVTSINSVGTVTEVRHGTLLQANGISSHAKFTVPKIIQLGKKHMLMQAYGDRTIKVQLLHNGTSTTQY
jgi:hypothetical protein